MLEARSHHQLKHLLSQSSFPWPHNLTLSRLVGRSLRKADSALIELGPGVKHFWWPGVLAPLCIQHANGVLVLSNEQRLHFQKFELPKLINKGVRIPCWEDLVPPPEGQLWLLSHNELLTAYKQDLLDGKHLIIPEAELLSHSLCEAMALQILPKDWESLRRAHPTAEQALMDLHKRLQRKLFKNISSIHATIRMDCSEILALKDLIGVLGPSPEPWNSLLNSNTHTWASWAALDQKTLNWSWNLKPIEPFSEIKELFLNHSFVFLGSFPNNHLLTKELEEISFPLDVKVKLGGAISQEPISLFIPSSQPLPNNQIYFDHVLNQSKRLILGQSRLTIIVLDDDDFRFKLTAELAAEYGTRVRHEATSPDSNGVICCSSSWWIHNYCQLPSPGQLIIALLPLQSVSCPYMASRVDHWKKQGRDWFRELLLPEALGLTVKLVEPMRTSGGRVSILDGRIRTRTWGHQFFKTLEPWEPLERLLPH